MTAAEHQAPAGPVDPGRPALPGTRLAGALVDGVLLRVVSLAFAGLDGGVAAALGSCAYLVYEVVMVAVRGQTVGKLAVGSRVVDAATGGRPSLWQAGTRAVVPLAGAVVDVVFGTRVIGVFWVLIVYGAIATDPERRGVHDMAAGTVVLRTERSPTHRRAGTAAVAAAVAMTLVLVLVTMDDLEDDAPTAAGATAPGAPAGPAGEGPGPRALEEVGWG